MNYGFALFLFPIIEYVLLCCINIYTFMSAYFGWLIVQVVGLIIPTGPTYVGVDCPNI